MAETRAELGRVVGEVSYTLVGISLLALQRLQVLRRDLGLEDKLAGLQDGLLGPVKTLSNLARRRDGAQA